MFVHEKTTQPTALFSFFHRPKPVPLYLVTGFLGAGKTSFISQALRQLGQNNTNLHLLYVANESGNQRLFGAQKPLFTFPLTSIEAVIEVYAAEVGYVYSCVLQPQNGLEWKEELWLELQDILPYAAQVAAATAQKGEKIDLAAWTDGRKGFDYCFVELNGSFDVDAFWEFLPQRRFPLMQTYYLQDLAQFQWQLKALGDMVRGHLVQSQSLILTTDHLVKQPVRDEVVRQLKTLNPGAKCFLWMKGEAFPLPKHSLHREKPQLGFKLVTAGLGLWTFFILLQFLRLPSMNQWNIQVQQVGRFFLSLLFQIMPFLLLSAFISSILQLWVKEDTIYRLFKRRSWLALPLAMSAGFILPICDCGLIPIITRLRKKGLPLPYAILFFVSATVTNPLVFVSNFLAFPGQNEIYIYRLFLTWLVGLLLALALVLWEKISSATSQTDVEQVASLNCASGYLGRFEGCLQWKRFSMIMRHTAQEFMTLLSYIIPGIFVSSLVHASVQSNINFFMQEKWIWQWLVLLLAIFFMSICANANAFIAKSFAGIFPFPVLLIYMVFSPLLDVKNLLLFRNGFGRRCFWQYVVGILFFLHLFFFVAQVLPVSFFPRFGLGVLGR